MVERRPEEPCVASSILALGTIENTRESGCFVSLKRHTHPDDEDGARVRVSLGALGELSRS